MPGIIVTSNKDYVDIDGLASALAYTDLLKLEGKESEAVLEGPFTYTVTPSMQKWGLKYSKEMRYVSTDFVLVDISDAKHFSKFVNQNNIIEIFDHHYGFENFWKERLGTSSIIEPIGSCATLIWEQYRKRGKAEAISATNANLLATAIVSNTLNFRANITNQKDITAFKEIQPHLNLPDEWIRKYFEEQEDEIYDNTKQSVIHDTLVQSFPNLGIDLVLGQVELWNGKEFIENHKADIEFALSSFNNNDWLLSCPSISEAKTYFYTKSDKIRDILSRIINLDFDGDLGILDQLLLRKEVKKKILELK